LTIIGSFVRVYVAAHITNTLEQVNAHRRTTEQSNRFPLIERARITHIIIAHASLTYYSFTILSRANTRCTYYRRTSVYDR